ncbi:MAG: hypothetical protein LBF82_03640 [Lactobacillales bacterium]|nr:hypothetical protein [Lactobacillales bacterium]
MNISIDMALKRLLRKSITNLNVNYEFPLAEAAIEILGCLRLGTLLFSEKQQIDCSNKPIHNDSNEKRFNKSIIDVNSINNLFLHKCNFKIDLTDFKIDSIIFIDDSFISRIYSTSLTFPRYYFTNDFIKFNELLNVDNLVDNHTLYSMMHNWVKFNDKIIFHTENKLFYTTDKVNFIQIKLNFLRDYFSIDLEEHMIMF